MLSSYISSSSYLPLLSLSSKLAAFAAKTDTDARYSLTVSTPATRHWTGQTTNAPAHSDSITVHPDVTLISDILDDLRLKSQNGNDTPESLARRDEPIAALKDKAEEWWGTFESRSQDTEIQRSLQDLRNSLHSCYCGHPASVYTSRLEAARYCLTGETDDPSAASIVTDFASRRDTQNCKPNTASSVACAVAGAEIARNIYRGSTSVTDYLLPSLAAGMALSQGGSGYSGLGDIWSGIGSTLRAASRKLAEGTGGGGSNHVDLGDKQRWWARPRL